VAEVVAYGGDSSPIRLDQADCPWGAAGYWNSSNRGDLVSAARSQVDFFFFRKKESSSTRHRGRRKARVVQPGAVDFDNTGA